MSFWTLDLLSDVGGGSIKWISVYFGARLVKIQEMLVSRLLFHINEQPQPWTHVTENIITAFFVFYGPIGNVAV